MSYKGKVVCYFLRNRYTDDNGEYTYHDSIGLYKCNEEVEAVKEWGRYRGVEMPIFVNGLCSDGSEHTIRFNKGMEVPMYDEKELKEDVIFERDGVIYEFQRFVIHNDSETGLHKDYLYEFRNTNTDEIILMKSFWACTRKPYPYMMDFFNFYEKRQNRD